jgi:hypothetical protein
MGAVLEFFVSLFDIIARSIRTALSYVGAFYRWIFFLCRKPYYHYDKVEATQINAFIGVAITAGLVKGCLWLAHHL